MHIMEGKKYFATLSGFALIVAAATPAFAASDAAHAQSKVQQTVATGKRAMPHRVSGEIVSIDPAKKVVAVKHKNRNGKDVTVVAVVDDHTKIREGKTDKSFADLKVGEHVQINYERQHKRDLAHEVLVQNNSN
jgi:hypothetical protein